jgi:hypothetical protein
MRNKTLPKVLFTLALFTVLTAGFLHLSAAPAEAAYLNCSLYSQPGCWFVDVIQVDDYTYCCYYEGPDCRGGQGYRIGPCYQLPF